MRQKSLAKTTTGQDSRNKLGSESKVPEISLPESLPEPCLKLLHTNTLSHANLHTHTHSHTHPHTYTHTVWKILWKTNVEKPIVNPNDAYQQQKAFQCYVNLDANRTWSLKTHINQLAEWLRMALLVRCP